MKRAAELHLAQDVFFCITQGHGVFLDLRRDTYSAVLLTDRDNHDGPTSPADIARILEPSRKDLLDAGLLVLPPAGRTLAIVADRAAASSPLLGVHDGRLFGAERDSSTSVTASVTDVWRFFAACRRAARLLRRQPMSVVVERVRTRRESARAIRENAEEMRRLVLIFRSLRPWYPRDYRCLFEALALIEFLAGYGVYPSWVFGVQVQPFGAHCWIEAGGRLLNESLEYRDQFTPIMRV